MATFPQLFAAAQRRTALQLITPAFVEMERQVIELGQRQRRQRAALESVGAECRRREAAGESPRDVRAFYASELERIEREIP